MNFVQSLSSGFRRLVSIFSFHVGYSIISNAVMFFMPGVNDVPLSSLDGFILRVNFGVRKKKEKKSKYASVRR